jgi:hypothetical protein
MKSALILHVTGNSSKDVLIYYISDISANKSKWSVIGAVQKISVSHNEQFDFPTISLETCSLLCFNCLFPSDLEMPDLTKGIVICCCDRDSFGPQFGPSLVCELKVGVLKEDKLRERPFIENLDIIGGINSLKFVADVTSEKNVFDIEFVSKDCVSKKASLNETLLNEFGGNCTYEFGGNCTYKY